MKSNQLKRKVNKGFTLIETLVYVAIFAIMIGAITIFASNIQASRLRMQILLEVNDQGNSIVRTITQTIRNADSITSPTIGNNSSNLSLASLDISKNPTAISESGDILYITEGVGSPIALSNNKVKMTNLTFSNLSRPSTPGVIQFRFTLKNIDSAIKAEQQYSVDFYGTASIK
jgi:prepilin-type N-terminal cleavage/methylation domain-containing protein